MTVRRLCSFALLLLFLNITIASYKIHNFALSTLLGVILASHYIFFNIVPRQRIAAPFRIKILCGGYEITLAAMVCLTLQMVLYIILFTVAPPMPLQVMVINTLLAFGLLFLLFINGAMRIFFSSSQLGLVSRISLLFLWWVPLLNLFIFKSLLRTSGVEYTFASNKHHLNAQRKHEEVCRTKYPLLMVHGIFFRDWKNFNYWGRIPAELSGNGAQIYYGNHQSSAPVEACAEELKQRIEEILQETGCEKVNIIAHSKGGLDSRYLVSCLGMGDCVASLTTINTPHFGCNYVRSILDALPQKAVNAVGKGYDSIYTKLGDDAPDFLSGLVNLTEQECARLNSVMPDVPDVMYQSVGSYMRSPGSAIFPLNIGYSIIKHHNGGKNDGLVSTSSMGWGDYLGAISPKGKHGISHGDMIDLTRKNVEGFDVCEFYVSLVNGLKQKGL